MATYESIATATNEDDGDSLTIAKPTGLDVGDLMIAILGVSLNVAYSKSGWTQVFTRNEALANSQLTCLFKIADSSDVAASDFVFSHTDNSTRSRIGTLIRVSGTFSGSGNIASDNDVVTSDSTPTYTGGAIPPNGASALAIMGAYASVSVSSFSNYAVTNNNPSWTERADININGSHDISLGVATGSYAAGTTTGDYSLTITSGTESVGFVLLISDSVSVTVTPSVISLTAQIQAPSISGGSNVSVGVVQLSPTINDPTIGTAAHKWNNTSKSGTSSMTNTQKS